MRIEQDIKLDFKDVMFRPKRSTLRSRSDVELERTYTFRNSKQTFTGIPIMAANMDTTGTFELASVLARHKCFVAMHKFYDLEAWQSFADTSAHAVPYVAVSSGTSDADFTMVKSVLDAVPGVQHICMDVANGYSQYFVDAVRKMREAFPRHVLHAGNVVTGEMVEELILTGADCVKVGIGPGSVCTTRRQTGVGYPQLSAVIECADAAHGLGGHVISDGGCACPGDVSKAFGAGADWVMLGGMFAGHNESGGELVDRNGQLFKRFYGMSSAVAMKKYTGGVAEYRASEGKAVELPYRGPVEGTLLEVLGGLRSTCTYVGAASLKELSKRTTFVRCTAQLNESLSHHRTDTSHGYTRLAGGGGGAGGSSVALAGAGQQGTPIAASTANGAQHVAEAHA